VVLSPTIGALGFMNYPLKPPVYHEVRRQDGGEYDSEEPPELERQSQTPKGG